MFNSFYGETLKAYQNWISSSFRSPAVTDRMRDYLLHLAVESPSGCLGVVATFMVVVVFFVWMSVRAIL